MGGMAFANITRINQKYYAFALEANGLFEIDFEKKKERYIASMPNADIGACQLVYDVKSWNNKVIGMPFHSDSVYIYDIVDKTAEAVKITENFFPEIRCSFIWRDKLYIPGNLEDCLYIYDLCNEKLEKISMKILLEAEWKFCWDAVVVNDCAYLVSNADNRVIKLDLQLKQAEILEIAYPGLGFNSIICFEDKVLISTRVGGHIAVVDTGTFTCVKMINVSEENDVVMFSKQLFWDGTLHLIPANGTSFFEIDLNTWGIKEMPLQIAYIGKGWNFPFAVVYNGQCFAFSISVRDFVSMDEIQRRFFITLQAGDFDIALLNSSETKLIMESELVDLGKMIKFLCSEIPVRESIDMSKYIGKEVYDTIKGE